MQITRSKDFTAEKAWHAINIACMQGITTRLHWTDKPYHWHTNDGEEVFVVLDGKVTIHYEQ
jgi:mannose-6-phosphate isomerase-like protein (cupin superfamily)